MLLPGPNALSVLMHIHVFICTKLDLIPNGADPMMDLS